MIRAWLHRFFQIEAHESSIQKEIAAGAIGFFTIVYIVAVNSLILSEAGIPLEGAIVATILTSIVGCLLMGLWANAPIILVPGMGINALFSYTLVQTMGLTWQEALAVVFVSGILFMVVAFTNLSSKLSLAIPQSLKVAITVGLGLFIMLIGLEKAGLVVKGTNSLIALGALNEPSVLASIITFIIAVILFLRGVPGNFLITIAVGTLIAFVFGTLNMTGNTQSSFPISEYFQVFGAMSFTSVFTFSFWVAVFSLTMVLVFENIGLVHGHTDFIKRPEKFTRGLQANSVSAFVSAIFGTSPTVSTVESVSSMAAGGKTGLTSVTTGLLFAVSAFFIPVFKWIPDSSIAPILIIIGGLMLQNIRNLDMKDLSESFPAFIMIVMIPFTYSISDGIAIGFILYPLVKIAIGKAKDVSVPLYIIALLFFVNFVSHYI
jgi:adenine/guanine/hypoxanthine permease